MKTCAVDECDKASHTKGMRSMHHQRMKRRGTTDEPQPRPALATRFWSHVDKSGECWVWTGFINRGGYGSFSLGIRNGKRQNTRAHRLSFELANGPIPDGAHIDHMCHNKACVRPSHLRAVNRKENHENRAGLNKRNTSGAHGVSWYKKANKWRAYVSHNYKFISLGTFSDFDEAAQAAKQKRLELYTHNDIDRIQAKDAA